MLISTVVLYVLLFSISYLDLYACLLFSLDSCDYVIYT